ncbi:hypothetical protein TL16_g12102 [Triparma laevis f. inornata]|uniref:Lysine--tRNA ligase n=2 Tax=Triparma laevis TaxID=1534972 RepID=A0A9W7AES2_9STRA|nr:hypothetical protein TrLO_g15205 [Triparma laevis f. longispina]GMH91605.1 hypothetical protein TL16_g12102 [Triparma laevis f. inornata]
MSEPESKNAMKKRLKAEAAAKKKAEKEAAKKAKEASEPAKAKKFVAGGDDDLDPTQYYSNRVNAIQKMEKSGLNPYPHKFHVSHRVPDFITEFANLEDGARDESKTVTVAGRINSVRGQGKLYFYDLKGDGEFVQIMSDLKTYESEEGFGEIHRSLKRGDIIGCTGFPGKSKTGQLSIFPTSMILLSPCLHMLPKKVGERDAITDQETRYRQRYLDLICNNDNRKIFEIRAKVISYIRRFLDERNFLEVETPSLCLLPGGATAKPFKTFHNDLSQEMFMRIAPELPLKKLIIGGLERVYEIGRNYRNEGIDLTHNPEFTTCEFYQAYADYEDLMQMTEEMVSGMVKQVCGSYVIQFSPKPGAPEVEVDFTPPFKRISMISGLEEVMKIKLPALDDPNCDKKLAAILKERNLECVPPHTTARLLDELVGEYLEDNIVNPTFITEHPEIMSPLAKYHRSKKFLTERFELFVAGRELCNAYTELNNPAVQRERFLEQAKFNADGDDEAMCLDESFVVALEHGLPPTGGWGLGIDRLTMFLSNKNNIKEVLLFPAMKPNLEEMAILAANKPKEDAVDLNAKKFPACPPTVFKLAGEDEDLGSEHGMKQLDAALVGNTFLKGGSPSAEDAKLFKQMEKMPREAVEWFGNVKGWWFSVAQFSEGVRGMWK